MAITARELVFYIRAEDQASRVVKRVGKSFGSLSNIQSLQKKASDQQVQNLRKVAAAQQNIRRNAEAIARAEATASRLQRITSKGGAVRGYTAAETGLMYQAAASRVTTLRTQEQLLAQDLEEVRRSGAAASAAIEQQISQAKIARITSYVTSVQNLGRAFRLVGFVAGAALAVAANSAAKFGQQVTLAATQARPAGAGTAVTANIARQLQGQILQQMQQFPATAQEMADSFYQIFSGTNIQNVKQAANYVKLFNEAAVGGGATLSEMTQAGISIKNVFGVGLQGEFKNMTQALNVFFSAVRYGRMTASQFSQALGYISPIAKDVQLSFRNIAEDMAFFTRQTGGNMTRQDAQGLARLIQLLARDDVVSGLAQKGIPVFDKLTGKMRPVVDIIKQIHDQLKLTPQQTVNFFKTISAQGSGKAGTQGTIQAIRIFSQGIQNAKAYEQVVNNVRDDNNEFMKSYEALSKTPGVRWQVVLNQMKAAAIMIGTQAIPAFVALSEPLVKALHWFNSLSDGTKHTIATIGVFGSAIAVIGGTLIIVIGYLSKFYLTIKELQLARLASEAGFARVAFVGWVGTLLVLIPLLIKYHDKVMAVIDALGGLKNVLAVITAVSIYATLSKVAASIGLIGTAAVTAEGEVKSLRLGLLGLAGLAIPAIVIPLAFKTNKSLQTSAPGQPHVTYSGGISGLFGKLGSNIEYYANRAMGHSKAQSQAAVIKDIQNSRFSFGAHIAYTQTKTQVQNDIKLIDSLYAQLRARENSADIPVPDAVIAKNLQKLFPMMSQDNIKKYVDQAAATYKKNIKLMQQSQFTEASRMANFGPIPVANLGKTTAQMSDSEFIAALQRVHTLQKAYEEAPNLSAQLNAWRAYHNALDALTKKSTAQQKLMINDLLNGIKDITTMTDAQVLSLTRQAAALQKAGDAQADPAKIKEYYAIQKKLTDGATQDQISYASEVVQSEQALHDKKIQLAKDAAQKAQAAAQSTLQGLQSMYQNFLQQNQTLLGDLFGGPVVNGPRVQNNLEFGGHVTGTDLLHDLQTQVLQYRNINKQFNQLSVKGAPKAFIDQLMAMGPEASSSIKQLNQLTPAQFKQYIEAWNKGQKLVKANTMRELNTQLAIYRKFGKNVARAIITGVQSEDQKLQNTLRNMMIEMFPGLAKQGHLKPKGGTPAKPTGAKTENHTHYHVTTTAAPNDVKTQLKHADFVARNKYKQP